MTPFEKALKAKYDSANLANTFTGSGFALGREPSNPTFPYLLVKIKDPAPLTRAYGGASSYEVTVQFIAYGRGQAAADAIDAVVAAYDAGALNVTGGHNFDWQRLDEPVGYPTEWDDPRQDIGATEVWAYSVTFRFSIQ